MADQGITKTLDDLLERLAAIEHERWSHWQQYLHSKCVPQPGGSLLIPADLVARWQTQIDRKYNELSEEEKESDREQVRKYLPLIATTISSRSSQLKGETHEN
ncbi:MAG TPA: hypothetical protein VN950_25010 [Terriglobales bacterium]|nr:hypothetical protein [Terriglobales bacterium]